MLETVSIEQACARLRACGFDLLDEMHGLVEIWRRADGLEAHLTPERDGGGVSAYLEQMIRGAEAL